MNPKIYYSTDAGAPALSGTQGTLISVLDWCLVSGAVTPAGWSKPYSTTNIAVFRPSTGNRLYLRVDETYLDASITAARALGYETMSAHSTGTGQFPAVSQRPPLPAAATPGVLAIKSSTADATARPWVVFATETFFYLWMFADGTSLNLPLTVPTQSPQLFCFGDFDSLMPDDTFNTVISGSSTVTTSTNVAAYGSSSGGDSTDAATYVARHFTQMPGSCKAFKMFNRAMTGTYSGPNSAAGLAAPYPLSGKILLSRFKIFEVHFEVFGATTNLSYVFRGFMPGLYVALHNLSGFAVNFVDGITMTNFFDEDGNSLQGQTFMLKWIRAQNSLGFVFIETSGSSW